MVTELSVSDRARAEEAVAAIRDSESFLKEQPGYRDGRLLENLKPSYMPSYVHITHWDSLKAWEGIYMSPKFLELASAGRLHYAVWASAFKPAD